MFFDCVGSVASERDSDGDERIIAERGHGLQVVGNAGVGLAVGLRSEAARSR